MVEVMNEMGVNLVAFGNHEFDLKERELQARINESYFEWLGTNVLHQSGSRLEPFFKDSYGYKYFLPETYIWEVFDYETGSSVKIGFYSACVNDNQREYVYYEDPYQEAQKAYMELLAQQVDIVIGLTHLELPMDLKMAAFLPKTALIMGGHEHESSMDTVGRVVIAKADANAKTVYVHRFTYNKEMKELTLHSELVPIDNQLDDDPTVGGVVEKWQQVLSEEIRVVFPEPYEVIYVAQVPLDGRDITGRNQQSNLGAIIAESFAFAAKKPVDCAFFNAGSIRIDDQLKGNITSVDIFRALPFGGIVVEVELKGSLLKKVLDAGVENKGVGGYLQWHQIEFNPSNRSWKIGGKALDENKVYRVATSDFLFSGREARLEFFKKDNKGVVRWETGKEGDETDLRNDVRKAVVAFLKSKK
jgi:2',3'-cyclic-nucleotide 2'-phosphodiesterase (5'-nucleotidase family)